ncbi:hypothetical protein MKX01_017385 [Papaver californicum]|nr:hypothetical protein MKX01_017385 [Papaver californicum]
MAQQLSITFTSFVLCSTTLVMMILLPSLCISQDTFTSGACGYGVFGKNLNGGGVGTVSNLYRNGTGCGACYQIRCTIPQLCTTAGMTIVVTDHGEGDHTDFILSPRGFTQLAHPNMAQHLMAYGVIICTVSCQYPGYNLMFKVHEHSRFCEYLALIVIHQSGQSDISAAELWQEDCKEWRGMRKAYGGVWDITSPPKGVIKVRFQVSGADGQKWIQVSNAIPSDWKAGVAYDTAIQLS